MKNPNNKNILFLKIVITLIVLITSSILYFEMSYKNCFEKLSLNLKKNIGNVSCYKLDYPDENNKTTLPLFDNYDNVYEIEREKIGGANGIACSRYAYVSKDLPKYAKQYVAYHEFIHTKSNLSEAETNYKATIKEPMGMIQTVLYSVQLSLSPRKINSCTLASLWKTFKVYFLNDSFEDLMR